VPGGGIYSKASDIAGHATVDSEVQRLMQRYNTGAMPVVKDNHVVGGGHDRRYQQGLETDVIVAEAMVH
jgi:predicted transcriptional regulator